MKIYPNWIQNDFKMSGQFRLITSPVILLILKSKKIFSYLDSTFSENKNIVIIIHENNEYLFNIN